MSDNLTPNNAAEKQITLPFRIFVQFALPEFWEKIYISNDLAELIAAIDKDEQYVHVEFPPGTIGYEISKPRLWRIRDWRESYQKYFKDKARAAKERQRWVIFSENRARVIRHLRSITEELSDDDLLPIAEGILKNNKKLCIALGIHIEEPKE